MWYGLTGYGYLYGMGMCIVISAGIGMGMFMVWYIYGIMICSLEIALMAIGRTMVLLWLLLYKTKHEHME